MALDFLRTVFQANQSEPAIVWRGETYSYGWLLERLDQWRRLLEGEGVESGTIVLLEADFSPNSVVLFLAILERGCILVPLASSVGARKTEFVEIAQGQVSIVVDAKDTALVERLGRVADHELYRELRSRCHPGLVLFSSGSTGKSKAVVHDMVGMMAKFTVRRRRLRTVTFLLFDHLGGVDTMLYALFNGSCIVTVEDRTPDGVLSAIERHRAELLPTSPTFINLILLSEAYRRYDLSSLKTVSYGTEPMPESTLRRFHELFPKVQLLQTYGLSEIGVLRTKSKDSDSLWVKLGGEGFQTRIVDGILQIKAESAMLGYLNSPGLFTDDGWLITGDSVEVDGEYIRILGRDSEIINVGGEKVYPAEVESVIQEIDNVAEVTVYGEKNPITGNIVCARVSLRSDEKHKDFIARLKCYSRSRLPSYKVPVKVIVVSGKLHSGRFKKSRQSALAHDSQ